MGWKDVIDQVEPEQYLDHQGVDYKASHGASGRQLNLKDCPFCGGSHWKVYMNAETGLGNCFSGSCTKGTFNLTAFIQELNNFATFKDTASHVKGYLKSLGWRPARRKAAPTAPIDTSSMPKSWALPMNGRSNHPYLHDRGVDRHLAAQFALRYSARGVHHYTVDGEAKEQCYKHRIIIPIRDIEGEVVSFQGRDITGRAFQKYLFPPGSATQRWLYNADQAKDFKHLVVCEGVFDVMAITKVARDCKDPTEIGAVATFGKQMSADQFQVIQQMISKHQVQDVTMMYDREKSAIRDAIKIALRLKRASIRVRIALSPKGKDPAECTAVEVLKTFYEAMLVDRSVAARLRLQTA